MDDSLLGPRWFSTLNLQSGYWQVPLHPQHRHETAFSTSSGQLFEFRVLRFRLSNTPATITRLINALLKSFSWEICLAYFGDIIVFGLTWEEHLLRPSRTWASQVLPRPTLCRVPRAHHLQSYIDMAPSTNLSQVRACIGLCRIKAKCINSIILVLRKSRVIV